MEIAAIPEKLIKKAITGQPGSPDWAAILDIIGKLETAPSAINLLLESLAMRLKKDVLGVKLNVLVLIDALFKNGKQPMLSRMQCQFLYRTLSDPIVSEEPQLQNFIHANSPEWIKSCMNNNCLDSEFADWQKQKGSQRFVQGLSSQIKKKFIAQLQFAIKATIIYSQFLISAFLDKTNPDTPLLKEMSLNVKEINSRTQDLKDQLIDREVKQFCTTVFNFSRLAIQFYENLKKKKTVEPYPLVKLLTIVQSYLPKEEAIPEPVKENIIRRPLRTAGDDMTDEEFFTELKKIRSTVATPQQTIDLLSSTPPAPPQQDLLLLL